MDRLLFLDASSSGMRASEDCLRILCLGDVVGRPGRRMLAERLPRLRDALGLHMVIANGENAAGGIGLTPETLRDLHRSGVDVVTSGNHIWKHREMYACLDSSPGVLRPANYGSKVPGRGHCLHRLADGFRVGVVNLQGRVFMDSVECPFEAAGASLAALAEEADCCIVDFHAEASSEKRAMFHFLDGKVAAAFGTHTHVQTADAYVSAKGTATVTDLGMCGVEYDSVIGMGKEAVLHRFATGLPRPFKPAGGEATINGALVEVEKSGGKALSIRLLRDRLCNSFM